MNQYTENIQGKIFGYFRQKLDLKQSTKGWWRCDCIECGGHHTMGINLSYNQIKCFKCEYKAPPLKTIMEIERFDSYAKVHDLLRVQEEFDSFDRGPIRERQPFIEEITLPREFKSILVADSRLGRYAQSYLRDRRRFDLVELGLKGVGYCAKGEYCGYIIFPIHVRNKLVFYQARQFIDMGPKMKNPEEEKFGIGKSEILYNEDALIIYKHVRLVESITNALTLGDKGVASLGKTLSTKQFQKLIKTPYESITIMLDSDAYYDAIQLAIQLVMYKKVRVVRMPDGQDVNDLGKRESLALERATPYQSYQDLIKIRNKLWANERGEYSSVGKRFNQSFEGSL